MAIYYICSNHENHVSKDLKDLKGFELEEKLDGKDMQGIKFLFKTCFIIQGPHYLPS